MGFPLCLALSMVVVMLVLKINVGFSITTGSPSKFQETCVDDNGAALSSGVYLFSCPEAEAVIFSWVKQAIIEDPRMAASLLRLHFHDCFVNGCDASVLLDDTEDLVGEKTAAPNLNSLRGFEVIDAIKSDLETICPETVSCADVLATAARDSVLLSGGPTWEVQMGRRDSIRASKDLANNNIPAPNSTVATLITKFQNVGLTMNDMVALSGAHTLGKARCQTFRSRLGGGGGSNEEEGAKVNLDFLQSLQKLCSDPNDNSTLAELDLVTPATFDNQYYVNIVSGEGLLTSDQVLLTGDDTTRQIVETYAIDPATFFEDFKGSMLRMGSLNPLTGDEGEIRRNCRSVN